MGLSVTRVIAILRQAEAEEKAAAAPDSLHGLSPRTRSALRLGSLTSREQVLASVESGSIKDCPNLGRVGIADVQAWLYPAGPPEPLIDLNMSVADLFVHVRTTIQQRHVAGTLVGTMEQGKDADLLFLVRDNLEHIVIAVTNATE
jgi:hypothetical protein